MGVIPRSAFRTLTQSQYISRAEGAMLGMGAYNGTYSSEDPEAATVAESE